ncbi:hypothetical protein BH10ACT11_BH10ACT11_01990 [soil metagenome]
MKKQTRLRAWGPWIISVISLFVALSSSAVALSGKNSVDSGDIKPGAVKSQDLAKGAVKSEAVADGTISVRDIGYHKITNGNLDNQSVTGRNLGQIFVQYGDTFVSLSTGGTEMKATCPNGSRLISGGGNTSGDSVIYSSLPDVALPGHNPQTWIVDARLLSNTGGYGGAYALCLDQ